MRLLLIGSFIALFGCSSSGTHVTPPECEDIAHRCHIDSGGTATQNECHENAHDVWTAAECTSNSARCLAACPEHHDGG